jgi:acyl-CoA reductase-like NAD-dependent aldehyde dehydrogenase
MESPLIIAGNEIQRNITKFGSPFYEGYEYQVAQAESLEIAAAIGCARKASIPELEERSATLRRASQAFRYDDRDVEHAVRLTGMPVTQVTAMFQEIPRWLMLVPDLLEARFRRFGAGGQSDKEWINPTLARLFTPPDGFCYAITPGNDPRTSALVAANLVYLGVPFVLRASNKDAAAPLVIRALVEGGLDPNFCTLVYFDLHSSGECHFRVLDCSNMVWTFGPAELIDQRMRYAPSHRQLVLDLPGGDEELNQTWLASQLKRKAYRLESPRRDLFEGKLVLRHDSGNCAMVSYGSLTEELQNFLYQSIVYPLSCTATKSLMALENGQMETSLNEWMSSLVVGDPLDPLTQIGYIESKTLDALNTLVKKNQLSITAYGGERISPCQARPLLIASQQDVPDFFGQEIPAYVLAIRSCSSLQEAVAQLNHYSPTGRRLAVAFKNLGADVLESAILAIRAHAVMVDQPTTRVIPIFHEGNDYAQVLGQSKLVIYPS